MYYKSCPIYPGQHAYEGDGVHFTDEDSEAEEGHRPRLSCEVMELVFASGWTNSRVLHYGRSVDRKLPRMDHTQLLVKKKNRSTGSLVSSP